MEPIMIPVKHLDASPHNARRTATKADIDELKASILAHGLMQNLVVTAAGDGRFRVIAGGRRLEALRQLRAEGLLADDHRAPCQVARDEQAEELSLAENTVRRAMHPADEFEAFARLIEAGDAAPQIAARFGVTTRHVEQRLALGRLAPELLAAYRAEELTLDGLMAFTITDDHAKQRDVYHALPDWQRDNPRHIRTRLTEALTEADGKLARFVGLDAYHQAGGTFRADLFGESCYLEDAPLLHRLVDARLLEVRRMLEAEGWGWVEVSVERDWKFTGGMHRIYPQPSAVPQELMERREAMEAELEDIARALEDTESDAWLDAQEDAEARLAEIDEGIASHVAYDPQAMRSAGCYVTIGHDGDLVIDKGLVRREDAKRLSPAVAQATPREPLRALPETLRRALEGYRLQAAQAAIARRRLIALDLLIFTAACSVLADPVRCGLDVRFTEHRPPAEGGTDALDAPRRDLPLAWLAGDTEALRFQAFTTLSDAQKLDLLAWCVAACLKPQLATGREATAYEAALGLTGAEVSDYWRPTAANYLGRITRPQLLELGGELLGSSWAQPRTRAKKGELAAALERAFADPERHGRTPEQVERLTRWLPEGMEFGATVPRAAGEDEAALTAA